MFMIQNFAACSLLVGLVTSGTLMVSKYEDRNLDPIVGRGFASLESMFIKVSSMKHLIKLSNYYHLSTVCKNPKLTFSQCASNCHRREECKAFVSQSDHDCLLLRKIGESERVKKFTTATVIMKKISGSLLFLSLHEL